MNGNATTHTGHMGAMAVMVTSHWPVAVTSIVLGLTTWLLQVYFHKDVLAEIPMIGTGSKEDRRKQYMSPGGAWNLYKEGYKKVKQDQREAYTCANEYQA
jgi:hypothetical protein